jgi:type IV pilus assembly protein PilF
MKLVTKIIIIISIALLSACGGAEKAKIGKGRVNLKQAAVLNVKLASGYIKRGDLKVAMEKLDKALIQDDEYVPAYTTYAVLMEMTGEIDKAESYYLEALDIDNKNPELHNNYGSFLCKHGKYTEAIKELNKALRNRFYETPETVHANLGYCLLRGDYPDYKKSEFHLRRSLSIQPKMASALITMGELGIETERFLMARAYMQRYHAIALPSAKSLWYQIQAEKALGDEKHFIEISRELLEKFPDSKEAENVMEFSER